jgi:hypothetical protein
LLVYIFESCEVCIFLRKPIRVICGCEIALYHMVYIQRVLVIFLLRIPLKFGKPLLLDDRYSATYC